VVDGEWYPQPQTIHEPMTPAEKRAACPACGLHHGSVGATLNCMANAIYTLRAQRTVSDNEEKLAERAYNAFSTALFGVPPNHVKIDPNRAGHPSQANGVPWKDLPEHSKRRWYAVIVALRS